MTDLGSTLSFVTPFVGAKFRIKPKLLHMTFVVSMSIRESVISRGVHLGCAVIISCHHTLTDLVELEMVDLDVIMGMD